MNASDLFLLCCMAFDDCSYSQLYNILSCLLGIMKKELFLQLSYNYYQLIVLAYGYEEGFNYRSYGAGWFLLV